MADDYKITKPTGESQYIINTTQNMKIKKSSICIYTILQNTRTTI